MNKEGAGSVLTSRQSLNKAKWLGPSLRFGGIGFEGGEAGSRS